MSEMDFDAIHRELISYSMKSRLDELRKMHPSGLMTARQVSEYLGKPNNARFASAFCAPMKAYRLPTAQWKAYRIEDVVMRIMTYEEFTEEENATDSE